MQGVQPKNIFIVDDDPIMAELLKDYLIENWSHNTTIIGTGEECLARMNEYPDIIIQDYVLTLCIKMQLTEWLFCKSSGQNIRKSG